MIFQGLARASLAEGLARDTPSPASERCVIIYEIAFRHNIIEIVLIPAPVP